MNAVAHGVVESHPAMRRRISRRDQFKFVAVLWMLISSSVVQGQWPAFPTPGAPRTADGKLDQLAPAPRAADGKPDLSGIWVPIRPGPNDQVRATADSPPLATFFDITVGFPQGLPLQPWAAELSKQRLASYSKDHPDAACLPIGNMMFHTHPQPRKIIQTPSVIVLLYEANYGVRQIFTDGRPLPNNDPQPWWYGYSIGRWEGDTLRVETTGFRDGGWLDYNGAPLTDAATVTERFRRVNYGRLEVDVTINDPRAYTEPWTVRVNQRLLADTDLIEFICNENNHR